MSNSIIDFEKHMNLKRQKEALKKIIESSGWTIDTPVDSIESDICIYLIDSKESCVVLYGCQLEQILSPGHKNNIHWGHFVLAWDVIADPRMNFDEVHKNNTIEFSLRALPGLGMWNNIEQKIKDKPDNSKAHVLVFIDRENMNAPLEVIVAYSEAAVMNGASINAIVKEYVDSV
jgi:hypothetical protein